MTKYHEYTGKAVIAHYTTVEFAVAVPEGSTDAEMRTLMTAAAENAALYGGEESRHVSIPEFSRSKVLSPNS